MKKRNVLFLLFIILTSFTVQVNAQAVRYLDPVFSQIKVDSNVVYGSNFSILGLILQQTNRTTRQSLLMNVHTPVGDNQTKRPLVIVFHSGNFLPKALTTNYSGSKEDSTPSAVCKELALRGYVTASAAYRIGWNPTDPSQDGRTSFLIQAAYRGIQDARTAIRYFKANADRWGIDTTKIVLWGSGTGGYVALGAAAFDSYGKVITTLYPANKFIDSRNSLPMVIEQAPGWGYVHGDVEAKFVGRVPPGGSGTPPQGDTLCAPNHVANTSTFQMCVNLGGAIGDLNWMDAKTPPILSFQTPYDLNAPYTDATLRVPISPTTSLPVVRVQGANLIQRKADTLKINDKMKNIKAAYDPFKATFAARIQNGPVTGLFPMLGDTITDSSPWDFVGPTDPFASSILAGAPRTTRVRALRYLDTIIRVFTPRACAVLNLPCASLVSTEDVLNASSTKLSISPNPSSSFITFESEAYNPIQAIELFDLSGRSVRVVRNINNAQYQLDRGNLTSGMYIAKIKFEGGILSKKIVFEKQ